MNIGILGAGNIARKMADTINKMNDATCYAIASRDEKRAKAFAKEYGVVRAYGSYEQLVQDEAVELIYIATPHSHHFEQAKLCLGHRKPVLCEKAFMANAAQASEILELSRKMQVFITEAIWTRYMPSRYMLEDIINSGEIGEVKTVSANLGYDIKDVKRIQEPALAGGALLDVGIYPLTFACMILGTEIEEMVSTCVKSEKGVDMQNAILLKYKGGELATIRSSALSSTDQLGIICGTKGYLIAENVNNIDKIKVYSSQRILMRELEVPEQITGFEDEVRASIKAIMEGQIECQQIPHAEILQMMKIMDNLREKWGVRYPFE
ncbi:Gfo/Idh/MocA family protein [Lachnospiraceae bacterium LCP25S3_G4]